MAKAKSSPKLKGGSAADIKPIADVLQPNDAMPAENSKSIIITKRPLMRDPMMAATDEAKETPSEEAADPVAVAPVKPASVSHQLVIQPLSKPDAVESIATAQPTAPVSPISPGAATVPTTIADVFTPASSQPTTPATPAAMSLTTDSYSPPVAPTATTEAKLDPLNPEAAEAQAEDAAAERKAAIAALIASQKYYLPVDGVELERARYVVALGVVLIIGLVLTWADIALDAGLVRAGNLPHTAFFQHSTVTQVPVVAPPLSQSYTAPLSKYSVRLPAEWLVDTTKSTAVQDDMLASPARESSSLGSTTVQFHSGPMLAATAIDATVDSVHYQPLAHTRGATVYLRELIYHTDSMHYMSSAAIVNDTALTVGASLKNVAPVFYTSDVNSTSQLLAVTTRTNDFPSVAAVRKYMQQNNYQQARSALLSLTSPKQ